MTGVQTCALPIWEKGFNPKQLAKALIARSEAAALALVPTVSAAAEKSHRRRLREDAKSAFAQRIAARWHLQDQSTPRFLCGHLEEINLRHLMPGEHFPYGASGMHFLECMICPKELEPVKPRKRKGKKAGKR